MDQSMDKTIKYLTEVETLGQDILTLKDTKLELSNAHNKYREAYRTLQQTHNRKTWMKCGFVYMELPVDECKTFLKKELDNIGNEIDNLQDRIKQDSSKMRDLEHQPGIIGIGLKPMSQKDARALNKAFGY